MNDSFGGGNFNTTQAGGAGAQSEQKPEGIVPVFIQQLLKSPEGNYHMWGISFGMVSCVAIVRSIDMSSTKITYKLEDHTGQIEAHYWLEEGDAQKAPDVMANTYAQIYGTVRQHSGNKTIMIFKIVPILGINKLTTHMLEVLNARYTSEQYFKKGTSSGTDFRGEAGTGFSTQNDSNAGGQQSGFGLEGKHLAVFHAIRNHAGEEGISMQELRMKFGHMSAQELQNITEFLTNEGLAYTSVDFEHFLCTENGN